MLRLLGRSEPYEILTRESDGTKYYIGSTVSKSLRLIDNVKKGFRFSHAHLEIRPAIHVIETALLNYHVVLTLFVLLPQGAMPKARRDQVHHQRVPLLQLGFGLQRRGCRGYREGERERVKDWLDEPEP